jgi:aryl-alcohol dehydrogenase-like predicted oxidoreductase
MPFPRWTRREFVAASAATAMSAALARKADAAPTDSPGEWRNRQSGMSYRRLGRTGYMISEVVMGGNTIAPDNYEHVLMALDMGLNYLDTAPAYGNTKSELGYAKVIAARKRDSFFLNTKISVWDQNRNKIYDDIFKSLPETDQKKLESKAMEELERREALNPDYLGMFFPSQVTELKASALANVMEKQYGHKIDRGKNYKQIVIDSLEASLKRLGTDHVDLLMCPHGASTQAELLNHPEIFEAFEVLKKQGKVRHLGVSAHNDPAGIVEAAVRAKIYSAAMIAFNIVNRAWTEKAVAHARVSDFGVIGMKVARPVFNGRNNGMKDDPKRVQLIQDAIPGDIKVPQKAYLWALQNPNLTACISELVNAGMVKDNLPLAAPKPGTA